MKSCIVEISIISTLMVASACNDTRQSGDSYSNQDSIASSMNSAKNRGEQIEGKFLNIQRLTDKTYALSIRLNQDSIAVFETNMPLDQNEISLLKKEGNNIILTYMVYQNPVTRQPVKIVQYMQPVYEYQGK